MEVKEIIKILESEYGYEFNKKENKHQYEWLSELIADVQKVVNLKLNIPDVSGEYCDCEHPTLGKSVTRCGTCDKWFKPV